jgi:hypothetical protein
MFANADSTRPQRDDLDAAESKRRQRWRQSRALSRAGLRRQPDIELTDAALGSNCFRSA